MPRSKPQKMPAPHKPRKKVSKAPAPIVHKKLQKLKPPTSLPAPDAKGKVTAPADHPEKKQDGSEWVPWDVEVARRNEKAYALIAAMTPEEQEAYWATKCTANTTGNHGPMRRCRKSRIPGLMVCATHGGSAKHSKEAARKRFMDELHPSIERLAEIRDQSEHYPSALAATVQIINRNLGKVGETDKDKGAGRPQIIIGTLVGGLPKELVAAATKALPEPAIDADLVPEEDFVNEDA